MSRTLIRQDTQIRNSDLYDDTRPPGSTLESSSTNIEDDLNSLRSQMKRVIWADDPGNWYDDIPIVHGKKRAIRQLNVDLDELEIEHEALAEIVDGLTDQSVSLRQDISRLETREEGFATADDLEALQAEVETQGGQLRTVEIDIDRLTTEIEIAVDDDIESLQEAVDTLFGQASAAADQITRLERREENFAEVVDVEALLAEVQAQGSRIETLGKEVEDLNLREEDLTSIDDHEALQAEVQTHGSRIETLGEEVADLSLREEDLASEDDLEALQAEVQTHDNRIETLGEEVADLSSREETLASTDDLEALQEASETQRDRLEELATELERLTDEFHDFEPEAVQSQKVSFDYTTTSPLDFGTLPVGSQIVRSQLVIDEPFDTAALLSLGTVSVPDSILDTNNVDPETAATYESDRNVLIEAADRLRFKIDPQGATQGRGHLFVELG